MLAFAASLVLLSRPASAAATLVVDDDGFATAADCNALVPTYMTIGAAITAASPGDTIKVCPGLYAEQVQITKTLTILGAQAGSDATMRTFVPANESIIDHPCGPVQIMADDVVLNGFTVQGSFMPDPCFLAGIWTNPAYSGTQGGHQILYNIVQDNISGIELDSTCAANPTLVQFNLIQNNSVPGNGSGNGIQTNFGLCHGTIDRNKFSGDTNSSILMFSSSNISVTNNTLASGTQEGLVFGAVNDLTITGNVSISTARASTIRLFADSNVSIDSNTLLTGMSAIRLSDGNTGVTGHMNCIQGNSVAGLELFPGGHVGTLNADMNWWGSSTGPTIASNPGGTGDAIIDPDGVVDYTPFLPTPPGPPCPAAPPPPNTPGRASGGGKIESSTTSSTLDVVLDLATVLIRNSSSPTSVGGQATFGFSVTCCPPKGNLEYNDHQAGVRIKMTSVDRFVIGAGVSCPTGKHAHFEGGGDETTATGTTQRTVTVDVDDCGEPGSSQASATPDMFNITTTSGYTAGGPLIGGNIQVRQ